MCFVLSTLSDDFYTQSDINISTKTRTHGSSICRDPTAVTKPNSRAFQRPFQRVLNKIKGSFLFEEMEKQILKENKFEKKN